MPNKLKFEKMLAQTKGAVKSFFNQKYDCTTSFWMSST